PPSPTSFLAPPPTPRPSTLSLTTLFRSPRPRPDQGVHVVVPAGTGVHQGAAAHRGRDAQGDLPGTPTAGPRSGAADRPVVVVHRDRKSTRLNSSHQIISYAVFCLKKKK